MYVDTRYLFLLIRFKYRSLFFNRRFFGESGCKDTTFFQYAKIFFQKIPFRHADSVVLQRYASEKKFSPPAVFRPAKRRRPGQKGEKLAPQGRKTAFPCAKTQYRIMQQRFGCTEARAAARVINSGARSPPPRSPYGPGTAVLQ